jgi:hypothetical protein
MILPARRQQSKLRQAALHMVEVPQKQRLSERGRPAPWWLTSVIALTRSSGVVPFQRASAINRAARLA